MLSELVCGDGGRPRASHMYPVPLVGGDADFTRVGGKVRWHTKKAV